MIINFDDLIGFVVQTINGKTFFEKELESGEGAKLKSRNCSFKQAMIHFELSARLKVIRR